MKINKKVYAKNREKKRFEALGTLTCGNCFWWISKEPWNDGFCTRHPKSVSTVFEHVCGEHTELNKKDFKDAWICAKCGEPVENGYRCQCGYVYQSIDYAIPEELDGE